MQLILVNLLSLIESSLLVSVQFHFCNCLHRLHISLYWTSISLFREVLLQNFVTRVVYQVHVIHVQCFENLSTLLSWIPKTFKQ